MENATKALIIAGAVLVSILIVGMGILLVNSNNDTSESANQLSSSLKDTANETTQTINGLLENVAL